MLTQSTRPWSSYDRTSTMSNSVSWTHDDTEGKTVDSASTARPENMRMLLTRYSPTISHAFRWHSFGATPVLVYRLSKNVGKNVGSYAINQPICAPVIFLIKYFGNITENLHMVKTSWGPSPSKKPLPMTNPPTAQPASLAALSFPSPSWAGVLTPGSCSFTRRQFKPGRDWVWTNLAGVIVVFPSSLHPPTKILS